MIIPVIMAGGSGTRLWPMSRTTFPKQFLALTGQLTMLQQTSKRLEGLESGAPIVITNEEHRFLVAEQMRQQELKADIILEPVGRNTAPAIALAAMRLLQGHDEGGMNQEPPVMLVLASDHVIQDTEAFQKAVLDLLPEVQAGKFGTLGILPSEPATGYGYIKRKTSDTLAIVENFVEKPDLETAQAYVEQGYLWNSGMFMVRADRYLDELNEYRSDIYRACKASIKQTTTDMDFIRVDGKSFEACPDESIDYAVMEPLSATGNVIVTALDAGWSDVGSWSTLWEIADKCENGNAILGKDCEKQTILKDTKDSFIFSESRLVTTLGIEGLVIVDTPDALLVADKNKVQNVKEIVSEIKKQGRSEHYSHREVYRPWGKYDSIDNGDRYQVKHITVNPGSKLSVQMHHHRAEHWIVVSGTAKVTNGEEVYLVAENESTYIPIGQVHALENPGVIPLEMIEVQSGSYLGEDDILRFDDRYGRK